MNEIISKEDIEKLLPHSGKMFLLSRVVFYSIESKELISEVDVGSETMFLDEKLKGIPSWVGFEYMAQSISALSGIYNAGQNKEPQIGFIMSVSNYTASVPFFPLGKTVTTHVRQTLRMNQAVTFEGIIKIDDHEVARGILNTVEVDSNDFFKKDELR